MPQTSLKAALYRKYTNLGKSATSQGPGTKESPLSLVPPERGRAGSLLEVARKAEGEPGWGAAARKLRQGHTCGGRRRHPIGFVELIQ